MRRIVPIARGRSRPLNLLAIQFNLGRFSVEKPGPYRKPSLGFACSFPSYSGSLSCTRLSLFKSQSSRSCRPNLLATFTAKRHGVRISRPSRSWACRPSHKIVYGPCPCPTALAWPGFLRSHRHRPSKEPTRERRRVAWSAFGGGVLSVRSGAELVDS